MGEFRGLVDSRKRRQHCLTAKLKMTEFPWRVGSAAGPSRQGVDRYPNHRRLYAAPPPRFNPCVSAVSSLSTIRKDPTIQNLGSSCDPSGPEVRPGRRSSVIGRLRCFLRPLCSSCRVRSQLHRVGGHAFEYLGRAVGSDTIRSRGRRCVSLASLQKETRMKL